MSLHSKALRSVFFVLHLPPLLPCIMHSCLTAKHGASYIKTPIRSAEVEKHLESKGIEFGLTEDCVAAMMRLACDKSITGHSLAVIGRSTAKEGFIDAEQDDWTKGEYWMDLQQSVINAFGKEWK